MMPATCVVWQWRCVFIQVPTTPRFVLLLVLLLVLPVVIVVIVVL